MSGDPPEKQRLLEDALALEGKAYRLLLAGDDDAARRPLLEATELYRRSWEAAGPRSFGRLIGMLKTAVLAGGGEEEAAYVSHALGDEVDSPAGSYALALATLIAGEDERACRAAAGMRDGSEPFERTAAAIEALAAGDRDRYAEALSEIVADFEAREEHLTGVPIADAALVLERIAARRGMAAGIASPLLPRPAA